MVRIVHPYLFGKKERFEHFAAWRDTSAHMREEHAWVQECISAVGACAPPQPLPFSGCPSHPLALATRLPLEHSRPYARR